jgi:CRP-like cAMP-binding protein
MEVKEVLKFATIVKQGEPGDGMYFILQGETRARVMMDGKETLLAPLSTGDFFGEISLFDQGPRSADVVANEDSVLLRIPAGSIQKMVQEAPDLAAPFLLAMGKTLTARIRADNKRYAESVAYSRLGSLAASF